MAKQFDHLFEEITSFENLWKAWKKAAKGKRGQVEVADFEIHVDVHNQSHKAAQPNLKTHTWQTKWFQKTLGNCSILQKIPR